MENHHFLRLNQLFVWPISIAMFVYQRVMIDTLVKDQAATMFQHDPGHQAAAHELREELEGLKERMAGGAVLSCRCHQRWLRNPPKM